MDVEIYSVDNSIGTQRLPAPEQADARSYVKALVDAAYKGKNRAALDLRAEKYKRRSWYFGPPPSNDSYWSISRRSGSFDPSEWWRKVTSPVLLVYGAKDERIPVRASIKAIEAALKAGGDTRITRKVYPCADHIFMLVDDHNRDGWRKRQPGYALS